MIQLAAAIDDRFNFSKVVVFDPAMQRVYWILHAACSVCLIYKFMIRSRAMDVAFTHRDTVSFSLHQFRGIRALA